MFRWLNGPGAVFKDPLPGSTNYINAYGRDGVLIRAKGAKRASEDTGKKDRGSRHDAKANKAEDSRLPQGVQLPTETADDLIPFPMNRQFRSQTVLCEDLKDEIWKRVKEQSQSVRDVSATLGVAMDRIGAVVRLKAVEKEWLEEVRFLNFSVGLAVMRKKNIRLV